MNPDLTYLYNIVKSASKELTQMNGILNYKPKRKTRKKNFSKRTSKKCAKTRKRTRN
jgi:hypothetical protein